MAPDIPSRVANEFAGIDERLWLASCSLAPRSHTVRRALAEFDVASADLGAWEKFETCATELRQNLATFLGSEPDQIALLPSASVAAYQAVSSIRGVAAGHTLTSHAEFPSLAHVWLRQQQLYGGTVRFADDPSAPPGEVGPAYLAALETMPEADLVSVPLVAYDTGERLPVAQIVRRAAAAGARTLVDAYQYLGTGPLDVREVDCDFLVGGTSKYLLGLPGLAFLYVRDPAALPAAPALTGWWGRVEPLEFDHHRVDFPDTARRFEIATLPVPAVYAALSGLNLLSSVPAADIESHRDSLTTLAWDALDAAGRTPVTPRDVRRRAAHLAIPSRDAQQEAKELNAKGVVCSPRGDLLRFAFHLCNDADDVEQLSDLLTSGSTGGLSTGPLIDRREVVR